MTNRFFREGDKSVTYRQALEYPCPACGAAKGSPCEDEREPSLHVLRAVKAGYLDPEELPLSLQAYARSAQ